jgi:cell division protein FtsI/penicillin-binding protein 2
MAIGQEIGVTPLQIVSLMGAIANGGILSYVVKIQDPSSVVTKSSSGRVLSRPRAPTQAMLRSVNTDNTAKLSRDTLRQEDGNGAKATPGKGVHRPSTSLHLQVCSASNRCCHRCRC